MKRSHSGLRRRSLIIAAMVVASSLSLAPTSQALPIWIPVASDEFTGPAGMPPNPAVWIPLTGGSGWGNGELETYTNRTSNASLDGKGHLQIVARKENYTGTDGIARNYTSARMYYRVPFQYGYLEARIKLPSGKGLWPAMWTVGADALQGVPWPQTGEIDIMEAVNDMRTTYGTIHGPSTTTGTGHYQIGGQTQPSSGTLADTWHTYGIYWNSESITWFLDGRAYNTIYKASLPAGDAWEFDKPHLLQLNMAVGGSWPGSPSVSTRFPATMLVDYVRYYKNISLPVLPVLGAKR